MNSQKELKQAYQLVTQDLFNRLVKAQPGEAIPIGTRGSFGSLKWRGNGSVNVRFFVVRQLLLIFS